MSSVLASMSSSSFNEDAESIAGAEGVPFLRKDIGASEAGPLQENGSRLFEGCRPKTNSFLPCRTPGSKR